jgi:hypothetical protein
VTKKGVGVFVFSRRFNIYMSVLVNKDSKIIVQGFTGSEGRSIFSND